jgi:NADPH:quinone reductase-like Zn-dependent oxidoreductase
VRAIVWTRYGAPEELRLEEVPRPSPKDDEVLLRVRATTAAAGDCELRALKFSWGLRIVVRLWMGLGRPRRKVLGQEVAGEVEEVGKRATRFHQGDRVFGTTGFRFGGYAEYVCLPERRAGSALAAMPASLSFEEAAAAPLGGLEALHFLRQAGELRGRRVLINGAGGGIGVFAVQLAKQYGAEVTAVDRTDKLAMLRSIGADRVLDFTHQDFTRTGDAYDVVYDVIGNSRFRETLAVVEDGGRYLLGNPDLGARTRGAWASAHGLKRVIAGAALQRSEDLEFLADLLGNGTLRSVLDRRFPLDQMPEAHRWVESGNVCGKVIISL